MQNKGCITCKKCEQVRLNFYCGRKKLSQKQLYNKYGFCTRYEPVEQKPQTNEEWLRSCTTGQLAEVLGKIAKNAYQCCQDGKTNKCVNRHNCTGYCDYGWEMWLKQPHHESVTNCNE